jgi:hypothetical protein
MRRDQAAWDEGFGSIALPTDRDNRADHSSKEEGTKNQPWVANVYRIFAKVFNAAPISLEQEKRFKGLFNRAQSDKVALDAVDLMFQEGVRYPTGKDLREAIDRIHLRLASQRPLNQDTDDWQDPDWRGVPACCPGTFDTAGFVHWWKNHANDQSKAEARRAAKGLAVMARWVKAAEA